MLIQWTRSAKQKSLCSYWSRVVSCGWLAPPNNGKKEGTRYLEGAVVKMSCDGGFVLDGPGEHNCQSDGQWSGETTYCVTGNGKVLRNVELVTERETTYCVTGNGKVLKT